MASIGNSPTQQAFTPAIDYFSGNGSTTAFTLSRPVASVAQVQVTIDNVAQNPSSAFTVSANTITFTSAPLSGTNNIYVYYTSPITQVIAPSQGTVTSESFGTITNFTTTGNTVLGDATTDTLTVGVTGIVKDSSGNVGIGTASPAVNLDVNSSAAGGNICAFRSTATNGGYVQFQGSGSTPTTTGYVGAASKLNTGGSVTDFGMTARTNLVFGTNDGTERMRIDSAGSVAIGSTSTASATRLTLKGAGTGSNTLFNCQDSGGTALLTIREDGVVNLPNAVSGDAHLKIQQGAVTTLGAIASSGISIGGGGSNNQLCQIGLGYSGTYQPTAISSITVVQTGYTYADLIFATRSVNTDTAPSTRMTIGSNGSIGAPSGTNIYNASDARLKKNIQPLTKGLDAVNSLKPVSFNWITDFCPVENDKTMYGFVAQDTKEVDENLVEGFNNGSDVVVGDLTVEKAMRVNEKFIIPMLTKAIQELKAINDTQAETINALTARIEALEAK